MVFCFSSSLSFSQAGKLHYVLNQTDLVNYKLEGETTHSSYCITNNTKVMISISSGKIWVDPWQLTSNGICQAGTEGTVSLTTATNREKLELKPIASTFGQSINSITLDFNAWVYGLSAIPFRARLKQRLDNSDERVSSISTTNFALCLFGGHTIWGWANITNRAINNNAISIVGFLGPSYVDISKEVGGPTVPIKNKINPTVVYGFGTTFSRNSLGVTLYLGWENAMGNSTNLWVYNGKPFIGLGISTGFMK